MFQRAADQELQGQVVNSFDMPVVVRLLGGNPALNQPVAHGESKGVVAVAGGGGVAILGQRAAQVMLERSGAIPLTEFRLFP